MYTNDYLHKRTRYYFHLIFKFRSCQYCPLYARTQRGSERTGIGSGEIKKKEKRFVMPSRCGASTPCLNLFSDKKKDACLSSLDQETCTVHASMLRSREAASLSGASSIASRSYGSLFPCVFLYLASWDVACPENRCL